LVYLELYLIIYSNYFKLNRVIYWIAAVDGTM